MNHKQNLYQMLVESHERGAESFRAVAGLVESAKTAETLSDRLFRCEIALEVLTTERKAFSERLDRIEAAVRLIPGTLAETGESSYEPKDVRYRWNDAANDVTPVEG